MAFDPIDLKSSADAIALAIKDFGTKLQGAVTNLNTVVETAQNAGVVVTNNFFKRLNEVLPKINIQVNIKDKETIE